MAPVSRERKKAIVDLSTLVAPLSAQDFLRRHWPDRPYWSNDGDDRAAALRERIPELASAEAVLAGASSVQVFRPDGGMSMVPEGKAALPLYRLGLTCYLSGKHIPALREATERLAGDLGLPAGSIETEVFCSSGDSGAWMHSDFDVNFALLLTGRKRWRLAENHHIRNQTGVCVPGPKEAPDPLQLELADRQPFPDEMPDESLVIDVEGGGLVFMPRGWWHQTEASGDCLQVNFVMKGPTWMSVLTRALRDVLVRDPAWRGFAYDLFGPAERREAALNELAGLLPGLRDALDDLLAAEDRLAVARELVERSGYKAARG